MGFSVSGTGGHSPGGIDMTALAALRAYWEGLRKAGRLPARTDIDPRGIAPALEHAFLAERIAPGHAKFRLSGMGVHDLIGMEPAGMPLSALFDPASRSRFATALEQVFAAPAILDAVLEAERGLGRPALAGRMILLPLLNAEGQVELALGGLVTSGSIGRQPRRFAIAALTSEVLAVPNPAPRSGDWLRELAEAPRDFVPHLIVSTAATPAAKPAPGKTHSHLRLVASRPPE